MQPIWRMATPEPVAVIAFGPARLTRDLAGPSIVIPPEERIHSLAWLQRAALITSEEMELAIERLLGANAPPVPAAQPTPKTAIPVTAASSTSSRTQRRTLAAYIAAAVILILAVIVGGPYAARLIFARPTAVQLSPSPSPSPEQPSPTPTPSAAQLNLKAIVIKPSDLRPGYVTTKSDSSPLCSDCVPALYSLSVGIQNVQLHRSLVSGASVAPSVDQGRSVVRALTAFHRPGDWTSGKGLGDESFLTSHTIVNRIYFYVVWRTGAITEEIVLIAPPGSVTMQSAIDLAKIQQARTAKALR